MSNPIQLIVHGAAGRMGRRVVALAADDANFQLTAAIDHQGNPLLGQDAGLLAGVAASDVLLSSDGLIQPTLGSTRLLLLMPTSGTH